VENYDFLFSREEFVGGQLCYVLELIPRRKDKNLFRGNIWVDAGTYLLRRTEGVPAKTPSRWIREVRFVLSYGDVGGMWLQTGLVGTATVRILGTFTIVSRDVTYKVSELSARGPSANAGYQGLACAQIAGSPSGTGLASLVIFRRRGAKGNLLFGESWEGQRQSQCLSAFHPQIVAPCGLCWDSGYRKPPAKPEAQITNPSKGSDQVRVCHEISGALRCRLPGPPARRERRAYPVRYVRYYGRATVARVGNAGRSW
jgi:hypothetical protein